MRKAAGTLSTESFQLAFTSRLSRAMRSLEVVLEENHLNIPVTTCAEFNERNWGLAEGIPIDGKGSKYGEAQVESWFSWGNTPPGGESYEGLYSRIVGAFNQRVLPQLERDHNVLMVMHNSAIAVLRLYLEHLPNEDVVKLRFQTGQVKLYRTTDLEHLFIR